LSGGLTRAAYLLEVDPDEVADQYARAGLHLTGDPVEALGRALASSAPLSGADAWALTVRDSSPAVLGAVGSFSEACVPRLEALRWQVHQGLERLLYLDHDAVLETSQRLADEVRTALGPAALAEARFSAIPRGGHFVLGELSYLLDLKREQLGGPEDDRPWVIVDDCSISGLRFRETLDRADRSSVVFAQLCSHPDLRREVEADPRVERCLAGLDLHDYAPASLGDLYETWRGRWDARQPGRHFWLGKPDHVCFPWNEPDVRIWNPVTESEDAGWRVVPPSHCLKNRIRYDRGEIPLQVHRSPGPLRPGTGVAAARLGEEVVVARLGTLSAVSLSGAGADMWEALSRCGTISAAAEALTEIFDVPASQLESDLNTFLEALSAQGLMESAGQDSLS
jgi:hypothetical protein